MLDIFMALFDFIPVVAFLVGSLLLQRDLYNKMSKGAFAVFSAGTMFVTVAGTLKAIYKLLYYTNVCDFVPLNKCFFPMQTIGFLLAGIGVLAMVVHPQGEHKAYSVLPISFSPLLTVNPTEWEGTMLFVVLMIIGVCIFDGSLFFIALKNKCYLACGIIVLSFIGVLGMGYLSSKPELSDWIKEIVNTVGQGSFLVAAILLRKHGLGDADYKVQNKDF